MSSLSARAGRRRTVTVIALAATAWAGGPGAALAEVLYLDAPWVRLGVNRESGLPSFLGIGPGGSKWIARDLMPADPPASIRCEGGRQLVSVATEGAGRIEASWALGSEATPVRLEYEAKDDAIHIRFSRQRDKHAIVSFVLGVPFDPYVTSTTFLCSTKDEQGSFYLPGVLSAPDFGQIQVVPLGPGARNVRAQLVGSRKHHRVTLLLYFTLGQSAETGAAISRYAVPAIPGVRPQHREVVQRAWFNAFIAHAENDPALLPGPAPSEYLAQQIQANNTLSDPVGSCYFLATDMAFFTDDTPILSIRRQMLHCVSFWLDQRIMPNGLAYSWGSIDYHLDSNPSLIISAWDLVESLNDDAWLKRYLGKLEILGDYLAARDIDADGIVEAVTPGTPNSSKSSNAADCYNFGHKDAYSNALIYRAWACLADLEKRMGNQARADRYRGLARKLKAAYHPTFYDAGKATLAGWIDKDGRKVVYRFTFLNGAAVASGVVSGEAARALMQGTVDAAKAAGFTNYGFGLPVNFEPIAPEDYVRGAPGYADPKLPREQWWQVFLNGGVVQSGNGYYLTGLIRAGLKDEALRVLDCMLPNQREGKFQNGIINEFGKGAEVKTWDGKPSGYEGYLVMDYNYLLAAALMDNDLVRRLFRPVLEESGGR